MEENKEMLVLLQQIEKNSRQRLLLGRLMCVLTLVAAIFCGLVFVGISQVLPQVTGLTEQAQRVLGNLEVTTRELAQADLKGMVTDVNSLVSSSQKTMEKLNALDFKVLNDAIQDLSSVVEPMAKFFNAFR